MNNPLKILTVTSGRYHKPGNRLLLTKGTVKGPLYFLQHLNSCPFQFSGNRGYISENLYRLSSNKETMFPTWSTGRRHFFGNRIYYVSLFTYSFTAQVLLTIALFLVSHCSRRYFFKSLYCKRELAKLVQSLLVTPAVSPAWCGNRRILEVVCIILDARKLSYFFYIGDLK